MAVTIFSTKQEAALAGADLAHANPKFLFKPLSWADDWALSVYRAKGHAYVGVYGEQAVTDALQLRESLERQPQNSA